MHRRRPSDGRPRSRGAAWLGAALAVVLTLLLVSTGCRAGGPDSGGAESVGAAEVAEAVGGAGSADPDAGTAAPDPQQRPEGTSTGSSSRPSQDPSSQDPSSPPSSRDTVTEPRREPQVSYVSVPRLGMVDMPVRRYRGTPDDAPGTEIQNTGIMASPRGTAGLVAPGEVGNFLVTGHRSSHGAPLADLPAVVDGDRVRVRTGDQVFAYRVVGTRITSFRSPRSLRQQSAAVPGRPGVEPAEAMLTLSTCRTPEDRAEGNHWSDEHGNPEHRIDKIAVLERVRPA